MRLTDTGFAPFIRNTEIEVMDFATYDNRLLFVGKALPGRDSQHLYSRIVGDYVDTTFFGLYMYSAQWMPNVIFNAIEVYSHGVLIGGDFKSLRIGVGEIFDYSIGLTPIRYRYFTGQEFWVDSIINKLITYKGDIIAGGYFKQSNYYGNNKKILNGICKQVVTNLSVDDQLKNHNLLITNPNPLKGTRRLNIENQFHAAQFHVMGIDGRILQTGKLNKQQSKQSINIADNLVTGTYIIQVANEQGEKASKMIVVE
jgi:hypothetical protein